ncbi:MAG: hypothetical protein GXO75_16995 [Calditrichaeota bacterium]|nr:hypothetical protein [Calditrichota bacterium]
MELIRVRITVVFFLCFVLIASVASGLDTASYVVKVQNSNQYYLWIRAKAPVDGQGVVEAVVDSNSTIQFNFSDASQFAWVRSSSAFSLNFGSHQINIHSGTLGISVDKFVITSDEGLTPIDEGPASAQPMSIPYVAMAINLNGKGGTPIMGDATGDGLPDFVITGSRYVSVYDNSGALLWQKEISGQKLAYVGEGGSRCRPIDIDNDGSPEVVGIIAMNDKAYLAALDGNTGDILAEYELPALGANNYYGVSQIANLRGLETPQDVIIKNAVDGYVPFNLSAYKFENGNFQLLWSFISQAHERRAGCHRPKVADMDGDGADEVIFGHWCLEQDGSVRWEKPYGFFDDNNHIDSQRFGDIIPSLPGLEIAYASGSLVLDVNGNVVWRKDVPDGQSVALADMRPDLPGLEVLVAYQEPYNDERLFTSQGQQLWVADGSPQFAASYETYPIQWIGDEGRESVREEWGRDRSPSIYDEFNNLVVRLFPEYEYGEIGYRPCDVYGDYREELICFNENYIVIYENIAQNQNYLPSPWTDSGYRENQYNWVYY